VYGVGWQGFIAHGGNALRQFRGNCGCFHKILFIIK
jgi:hypothetical protein